MVHVICNTLNTKLHFSLSPYPSISLQNVLLYTHIRTYLHFNDPPTLQFKAPQSAEELVSGITALDVHSWTEKSNEGGREGVREGGSEGGRE